MSKDASIKMVVSAGSVNWVKGYIYVDVTVANTGTEPIFGSARALGFFLKDAAGQYVAGFQREEPTVTDMTGPIPNGGEFERQIHFVTGPVVPHQKYVIICVFEQTNDSISETFEFRQYYAENDAQK